MKTELFAIGDAAASALQPMVDELAQCLSTKGIKIAQIDAMRAKLHESVTRCGGPTVLVSTQTWENALLRIAEADPNLRTEMGQVVLTPETCHAASSYFSGNEEIAGFLRSAVAKGLCVCQLTTLGK